MKVSVLQDQLSRAIGVVTRAVDSRPVLPVLGNILLETEGSRLKLVGTNLEMSISTHVGAKVDRDGSITLPAKTFAELIGNLSPERVDLTLDVATQTVNVRCGMTNSNIKGIVATEFPPVPEPAAPDLIIPANLLREMIQQTVFAAAREDNRPVLTGLSLRLEGSTITLIAADGYRTAIRTAKLEQAFDPPRAQTIPARALAEVAKVLGDDAHDVGITLPGQRDMILFYYQDTVITSQVLEGKFPDILGLIPKSSSTAATMYTSDLAKALRRAEIFARDSNYSTRLIVNPAKGPSEPGEVVVIGKSAERGDNEGTLDASVEGEALTASFNVKYMIEALNAMPEERVIFEGNGASAPGVFRPENAQEFIYLIMPMSSKA